MENQNVELDLRNVERFQRHPLVFAKFDALEVGESFVLINDHVRFPYTDKWKQCARTNSHGNTSCEGQISFAFGLAVSHPCADLKPHPLPHHRRCGESSNRDKRTAWRGRHLSRAEGVA